MAYGIGQGWHEESVRHGLARKGIKTGSMVTNMQNVLGQPVKEEDIGYPIYDSQEQYPEEYDQLNHDNPLFTGMREPQQTLLSVPEFETPANKETVAKNFDKKLFDY